MRGLPEEEDKLAQARILEEVLKNKPESVNPAVVTDEVIEQLQKNANSPWASAKWRHLSPSKPRIRALTAQVREYVTNYT